MCLRTWMYQAMDRLQLQEDGVAVQHILGRHRVRELDCYQKPRLVRRRENFSGVEYSMRVEYSIRQRRSRFARAFRRTFQLSSRRVCPQARSQQTLQHQSRQLECRQHTFQLISRQLISQRQTFQQNCPQLSRL